VSPQNKFMNTHGSNSGTAEFHSTD